MTRPSTRAFALFAGVWLVLCGVLGARHEATHAHVIDARGVAVHGSHLVGEHHGTRPDIHAVDGENCEHDGCTIVAALHQASSASIARPALAAVASSVVDLHPSATADTSAWPSAVYRLAPKTSPPSA